MTTHSNETIYIIYIFKLFMVNTLDPRMKNRRQRLMDFRINMMTMGILKCEVCGSDQEIVFVRWFLEGTTIQAEVSLLCKYPKCQKSGGRPYTELFKLVSAKESERISFSDRYSPYAQNNQSELFNKLKTIKGFGIATAKKVMETGIRTEEQLRNPNNIPRLKEVLTTPQITTLKDTFNLK